MISIRELSNQQSNDYSAIARLFREVVGTEITGGNGRKAHVTKSCSVVIPFYRNSEFLKRNLIALANQSLSAGLREDKIEIILVNDGSLFDPEDMIRKMKMPFSVTGLKLKKNGGRSAARNLGLLHAKNEIVVFMDEDVVAPKDFLVTHLFRHEVSDKCVVVGFRQNIGLRNLYSKLDPSKRRIVTPPGYKEDFRFSKFIPSEWEKTHPGFPVDNFDRTCSPLKESNYLKEFGFGKTIGVWRLPSMLLTCNVSMPKNEIIKVGGFDMRFKGWGMEDVHLAAKLIADGMYIVPNLHASVYHLIQKNSRKETEARMIEFEKNVRLYDRIINDELEVFAEAGWRDKMNKYFSNKFIINSHQDGK